MTLNESIVEDAELSWFAEVGVGKSNYPEFPDNSKPTETKP